MLVAPPGGPAGTGAGAGAGSLRSLRPPPGCRLLNYQNVNGLSSPAARIRLPSREISLETLLIEDIGTSISDPSREVLIYLLLECMLMSLSPAAPRLSQPS